MVVPRFASTGRGTAYGYAAGAGSPVCRACP